MVSLLPIALDRDATPQQLERVRRNHHDAIAEIQRQRSVSSRIIENVTLADGAATPIPHGMGRKVFATHTPPRGAVTAGVITEVRDGSHDPTKYVVLQADGYGATITTDLKVE